MPAAEGCNVEVEEGVGSVDCEGDLRTFFLFFFFQAEDGIRDLTVTGVQTCALPICGTIISEAGSSADKVARIHSTAGGSPCTSTIFFAANFFAYSTSASRVACALNWNCSMLQRTRCGGFSGSRATSPPVPASRRRPAGDSGLA